MKNPILHLRILAIITIIMTLLVSCDLIINAFKYADKTKEFVSYLFINDYDSAVNCFALDTIKYDNQQIKQLKDGLVNFNQVIQSNWGNKLNFTLVKSMINWSTDKKENTPVGKTEAIIEFSNDKFFGNFKVLFDDQSGKIYNIEIVGNKNPVPNMAIFWLFGLVAIVVPIFNIFVIIYVKKNSKSKNWYKYLTIIIFNIPSIVYSATEGFSINPLSFQLLLGLNFSLMGYIGSVWTIGIPFGGIFWFMKTRLQKKDVNTDEIVKKE